MNFTKENLIKAIEKIDLNPELRNGRNSSTYDLIYNDKKYPPILVLSVANELNGGETLLLENFKNIDEAFKILTENNFKIMRKELSYFEELNMFLSQAKTPNLKTASYKKSFSNLNVKVSFGQGVSANIPWISFLREGFSTNNGIYPVYLLFKNENLLILAYGLSEENVTNYDWKLDSPKTINTYFVENNLGKPFRYGKSYVFKAYKLNELPTMEILDSDLQNLLDYYKSLNFNNSTKKDKMPKNDLDFNSFHKISQEAGLIFSEKMVARFVASLCTKPFLILSGLSGSGKTKLAQAFVQWVCESDEQYKIIPVGADWTNREPLLGYPNGLNSKEYITPDSGIIHLLLEALKTENENKPFFLILDEMNLSHVERYFADFLSIMESNDSIKLYTGNDRKSLDGINIKQEVHWPKNLYIIGTVNIDETTYMFSPKVLDRANVIEFRITEEEIAGFLENPQTPDLSKLEQEGINMAESLLNISASKDIYKNEALTKKLNLFFSELKEVGAEFGYRTASEIMQLITKLKALEPTATDDECLDIAIMQKLLPKLHGSRSKLVKVLIALAALSIDESQKEDFIKNFDTHFKNKFDGIKVIFDISFEKLIRMYRNVLANGFTSYAEA